MIKFKLVALLLIASFYCVAQETKTDTLTVFEFTLKDGSKIIGELLDQTKENYWVKTLNFGTVKLDVKQVVSVIMKGQNESVPTKERSSTFFDNQFGFKYFLVNTAIPAEPKKWYYTNQYLAFSGFTYGISKHVSAGVSFFTFVPTNFFSPNVKITLNPNSKFKVAVGGQYYLIRDNNGFGLAQLLFSSGDAQNNFTFGYSGFFSSRGINNGSVVTFGFVKKVSNKLTAISENNIVIPSETSSARTVGFLSAGLRFDRRMHAFDLGIYVPTSDLDRSLNVIPYVGFNVRMNK